MSGPYYAVIDARVSDPERYAEYAKAAGPVDERYGGEYLIRGGEFTVVEGSHFTPSRLVVIRFPSRQAFEDFYASEEYQAARALRVPASEMVWIGVEGYQPAGGGG